MKPTHPVRKPFSVALLLAAGCLVTACAEESPTILDSTSVFAAQGGNGKGGGKGGGGGGGDDGEEGEAVTVTSAVPKKVPQGATANVRVGGTFFEPGSVVEILLNGKKTSKIVTNSTEFTNDTELIANITVASDALLASYDVRVTTPRKKKGIGIELLAVIPGPHVFLPEVQTDGSGNTISGPGIYQDGGGDYLPLPKLAGVWGDLKVQPQCDTDRAFTVVLPDNPDWGLLSGALADPACGFIRLQLPAILGVDCPNETDAESPCSIGLPPEPPSYSPSVFFFFIVDTNGDGKRNQSQDDAYNIVWTDAEFTVSKRRDGTPCEWMVTGNTAELWLRPGDLVDGPKGEETAVALSMTVTLVEEQMESTCQ